MVKIKKSEYAEDWSDRLSTVVEWCNMKGDLSISAVSRLSGIPEDVLEEHKGWMLGEGGDQFTGREMLDEAREDTGWARKARIQLRPQSEEPGQGLPTACKERFKVKVPTKPRKPPSKKAWRTTLIWEGKHGGSRNNYTEEFTATVEFTLPQSSTHVDANEVGLRLLEEGLTKTGYPDVDSIERDWHKGRVVGTKEIVSAPEPPRYELEQTGSTSSKRRGMQMQVVSNLDKAKRIWRRIK